MSFVIVPQKRFILAPPLAPCFDSVRDVSHLREPQWPQALGYVDPSLITFFDVGTSVHSVTVSEEGHFSFPETLKSFSPILQMGLDYFFSMAVHPESIRCRILVSEFYNIYRNDFSRPKYGSSSLHIDQPAADFSRPLGHPDSITNYWYTNISWSSSLPTEFVPDAVPVSEKDSVEMVLTKISSHQVVDAVSFDPGTVVLHTGAVPHRTAQNIDRDVVPRVWLAMILYRPII